MINDVFHADIKYMQIMYESGNIDGALFPKELTDDMLIEIYKQMNLARSVDAKVLSLQRQGRAATYAPLLGQEATQIGSAYAMRKDDFFVPNFRQHGVYIARKFPLDLFFLYWRGFEEGSAIPSGFNGTPVTVPVSTQLPHAAGLAYAYKYKGLAHAVITYVGDGGTSEGDFAESLNFSGVFKLPAIFIIENNQWAISESRKKQTAAGTLAQKAIAAGIDSIQVDGNDAIAVYKATKDAIEKSASGPTVIECITYRMTMHTTSDDPSKYRDQNEVDAWKRRDPILRLSLYLKSKGLWNDDNESEMHAAHAKQIDDAVAKAETFKPNPKSIFENVFEFTPSILKDEEQESISNGFWQ